MTQSATEFEPEKKASLMVLATIRAVAAACSPETRLIGPVRCDDIIRSIDDMLPLDEFYPGQTQEIDPLNIYMRRDWRDGVISEEVMMGIFACASNWEDDAVIIGPLTAREVKDATFYILTGLDLEEYRRSMRDDCEP